MLNRYRSEINDLVLGLIKREVRFTVEPLNNGYKVDWGTGDAVCHHGSYGGSDGLLEVMGDLNQNPYDEVEGWLTADEVLHRFDKKGA